MRNLIFTTVVAFILGVSVNTWAMDHSKGQSGSGSGSHSGEHSGSKSGDHAMGTSGDHQMDGSKEHAGGDHTFKHSMMMEGIHSEFQVMSLKSMNMSDPAGNTHHVMVKLTHGEQGEAMHGSVGKIKVIAPSGTEQVNTLKDYGSTMAANFTFKEKGKYGIICLVQTGDEKRVFKFWYPHK